MARTVKNAICVSSLSNSSKGQAEMKTKDILASTVPLAYILTYDTRIIRVSYEYAYFANTRIIRTCILINKYDEILIQAMKS